MRRDFRNVIVMIAAFLAPWGCGAKPPDGSPAGGMAAAQSSEPLAPPGWASESAEFVDPNGATIGEAVFKQAPAGLLIRLELRGLSPGWHGIHFHQIGDCGDGAAGFKASGSHVDLDAREHGLLHPSGPEEGDLPNIYAGGDGTARAELFRSGAALSGEGGLLDADGFAVIAHANADDHETQPIGGAGDRVACAALKP